MAVQLTTTVQTFLLNLWSRMRSPRVLAFLKTFFKAYAVFALCNALVKIYLTVYRVKKARRLWKHLPGQPFDRFGTVILANAERFHEYFAEQALAFPTAPLVKSAGPMWEVFCNTSESVQWMLKDQFQYITKPTAGQDFMFGLFGQFIGDEGIFILRHGEALNSNFIDKNRLKVENEKWFNQRKVASRIFTKANFESFMYDTFVKKANLFIAKLDSLPQNQPKVMTSLKSDEVSREKVDLQELFFSFTMDSIEKFFFGRDVDTISGGMSEYAKAFDSAHRTMVKLAQSSLPVVVASELLLPFPFGKLLPQMEETFIISTKVFQMFSPLAKEFRNHIKLLDREVYKYIAETRIDEKLSERNDIIANFLNSKNFDNGKKLTDKMLRDIILNLTIAGRDTTACALSWLFFELSVNPEAQETLFEELKAKLNGRTPKPEELDPENLPYLNGCLYEALRLHPPVPTEMKIATRDLTYLDGTVIPKGAKLFYSPLAMGRNPEIFVEPLKFDPSRWIPFSEKQKTLYEFPVFQAGPRFCLGKDMAQFEAKLLTAMLVQNFKFELLEGEKEKIWYSLMVTISITNHPKRETSNLWIFPTRRDKL